MSPTELAEKVKQAAIDCGYVGCGITSAEPFIEFEKGIAKRMEQFPGSSHLYEKMKYRIDPREINPWVKSIVVCVRRYGRFRIPVELEGRIGKYYQFDRRYPGCEDFQISRSFEEKLRSLNLRVNQGDVPARWAGARAGVVLFGRNNFVFSRAHGSWINIETWLIDAELPADESSYDVICPENCSECIKACPTGALSGPFSMRMDRCIAYLTYSGSPPEDKETQEQMGEWIYGCDVCQDVCPRNKGKWKETEKPEWLDQFLPILKPSALAEMDLKTYKEKVHPLMWYIEDSEEGLERWRLNARRSLRNSGTKPGNG